MSYAISKKLYFIIAKAQLGLGIHSKHSGESLRRNNDYDLIVGKPPTQHNNTMISRPWFLVSLPSDGYRKWTSLWYASHDQRLDASISFNALRLDFTFSEDGRSDDAFGVSARRAFLSHEQRLESSLSLNAVRLDFTILEAGCSDGAFSSSARRIFLSQEQRLEASLNLNTVRLDFAIFKAERSDGASGLSARRILSAIDCFDELSSSLTSQDRKLKPHGGSSLTIDQESRRGI